MKPSKHLFIVVAILILSNVEGQPSCATLGERQADVVCTKGTTDYILVRRLVSDNNRTTGVTLRDCRITAVEYEAFHNMFSLEYIDLSVNRIQKLKLGVLDSAHNVKYLNLSYNLLSDFPLGLFDQKPNLEVLDLKGNRIKAVEVGVFHPLLKLTHLDLSNNELIGKNLNADIFDKTRSIRFIDFSRNDMEGTPDNLLQSFQAINLLNLDRCSLKEVPKFATAGSLKSMNHLILSTNQITSLSNVNTFVNLDNLEILNLVDNFINYINANVFKNLRKLKVLVFRNNKLKDLPDTILQNMPNLNTVDMSYNLIEFIPVNAFRGSTLKTLNLSHNRFSYLTDNFLLELRNSGTVLNKFYFNHNPWQCSCLLIFLKEVKAYEVNYNPIKYDGKSPVCVTTKEFNCKRHQNFNQLYVEMYYNLIK